jgi:hypothetical protein
MANQVLNNYVAVHRSLYDDNADLGRQQTPDRNPVKKSYPDWQYPWVWPDPVDNQTTDHKNSMGYSAEVSADDNAQAPGDGADYTNTLSNELIQLTATRLTDIDLWNLIKVNHMFRVVVTETVPFKFTGRHTKNIETDSQLNKIIDMILAAFKLGFSEFRYPSEDQVTPSAPMLLHTFLKIVNHANSSTYLKKLHCNSPLDIMYLPESIGGLAALTHLVLEQCKSLTSLPNSIGSLTQLNTLKLHECTALTALTAVPESIAGLQKLQILELEGCQILPSLPESIGRLAALTHLVLEGCESLTSLPESIGGLTSLTHLHIVKCNSLTSLPESVGELESLTVATFRDCKLLESIPESVGYLQQLKTLTIKHCDSLSSLPASIISRKRDDKTFTSYIHLKIHRHRPRRWRPR